MTFSPASSFSTIVDEPSRCRTMRSSMSCCCAVMRRRRKACAAIGTLESRAILLLLLLLPALSTATLSKNDYRLNYERARNGHGPLGSGRALLLKSMETIQTNNASSSDNNTTSNQMNVTIEATAPPLFHCRTQDCNDTLTRQQDAILANLTATYANATLLASTQRIANALFVQLDFTEDDNTPSIDRSFLLDNLRKIDGVQRVLPQETYRPYQFFQNNNFFGFQTDVSIQEYLGVPSSINNSCNQSAVRVAILDSGMDYTHDRLGGLGTIEAYEAAYGTNGIESTENTVVESGSSLFPNSVVVDGFDFLGDTFVHMADSSEKDARQDRDPIDAVPGHGTAVADAFRIVAPHAQLVALKVCSTTGHTCPDFAIAQAIEYALDPLGDGSRQGSVDIINLSLGLPYFSPYYDFISKLLEDVFHLGVVPVVAMGNHFNVPMVAGYSSISPSIISVGATLHPREQSQLSSSSTPIKKQPTMAAYSSRGPGFQGMIKPDLVAPSGLQLAASGSGTGLYAKITGTSFAAPLVAGAVALIKQKCGDSCSPFAIKALLMNNAFRNIRYEQDSNSNTKKAAPISHMGAGELQVDKSLDADMWAYCLEDVQPSISLGVLNVASTLVIERTLRITNISPNAHSLVFSVEFQTKGEENFINPMAVTFSAAEIQLPANSEADSCSKDGTTEEVNSFVDVTVVFTIDATKVPTNHMTSTGPLREDPFLTLDVNEFGGYLMITSAEDSKEISVPFMAILRKASDVSIANTRLKYDGKPTEMFLELTNHGAGVAQIDAFQVLSFGKDEKEAKFGDAVEKTDVRMVGYRVVTPANGENEDCTYMFEWAFQTWEPQARLQTTVFEVQVDVDDDRNIDFMISNAVVNSIHSGAAGDILIRSPDGSVKCAGLHADHHTYTSTTVLRVCSEDLGITKPGNMVVMTRVMTVQYTGESQTTATSPYATYLTYPEPEIFAPSYDVGPGETLDSILVSGSYGDTNGYPPLGLMLMTDAYRSQSSTGAATRESETLLVLADFVEDNFEVYQETTAEKLQIPTASNLIGPRCIWWAPELCIDAGLSANPFAKNAVEPEQAKRSPRSHNKLFDSSEIGAFQLDISGNDQRPSCPLKQLQRELLPSAKPISTNSPSLQPSTNLYSSFPSAQGILTPASESKSPSESTSPSFSPTHVDTINDVDPTNTSVYPTNNTLLIETSNGKATSAALSRAPVAAKRTEPVSVDPLGDGFASEGSPKQQFFLSTPALLLLWLCGRR